MLQLWHIFLPRRSIAVPFTHIPYGNLYLGSLALKILSYLLTLLFALFFLLLGRTFLLIVFV